MTVRLKFIFAVLVSVIIILNGYKLINRPATENDEGIYTATFLLIDKGYRPYQPVFFSQLPGFLAGVYPGFLLFGKTVQAARLIIYFWSVVALIALGWIGGFLPVFILLAIPSFCQQIITFQSDALALAFSTLSLVFIFKFKVSAKKTSLILSSIFFSLACLTKLDISLFIPIILTLFLFKKPLSDYLLFIVIFLLITFFLIAPFGVKDVISNVLILRKQAFGVYHFDLARIINFLRSDLILCSLIILSLVLFLIKKPKFTSFKFILFAWAMTSFLLLFFYRPIFPHHLVFLSIPFAFLLSELIADDKNIKKVALFLAIFLAGINCFRIIINFPSGILNGEQKRGVALIKKYSKANDFIISDEGILVVQSGRLLPPELADISLVRIKSGNLSADKFQAIIKKYQPRLIIAWNGRLESMANFSQVILKENYQLIQTLGLHKKIYTK